MREQAGVFESVVGTIATLACVAFLAWFWWSAFCFIYGP